MPVKCAHTVPVDLDAVEELHTRLGLLVRLEDSARIAALSTELLETLRTLQQNISAARDEAILALHGSGASLHDIARGAGLTRGRVFQIVQRGRAGSCAPPDAPVGIFRLFKFVFSNPIVSSVGTPWAYASGKTASALA